MAMQDDAEGEVLEVGVDGSFDLGCFGSSAAIASGSRGSKLEESVQVRRPLPPTKSPAFSAVSPGLANISLPLPSQLRDVVASYVAEGAVAAPKDFSEEKGKEEDDDTFYDAADDEAELGKDALKAKKYKEVGNAKFKEQSWLDAADMYTLAIDHCPSAQVHSDDRAVYYGNRAACFMQLEDYEQVVSDCSQALEAKAGYVKVLARRAQAYEKMEKFSLALADQLSLLEIDPGYPSARAAKPRLERLQAKKDEKTKEEAIGKLKELGNSLLSNFGLSLDNFKVDQQEGGGYSINFNQNPTGK